MYNNILYLVTVNP